MSLRISASQSVSSRCAPRIYSRSESSVIVLAVAAEGVQIYESKPNSAGGFQWSLKVPQAELKSTSGEVLGKDGAGPSWTLNDAAASLPIHFMRRF
jgi:hypothetical protein